MGSAVGVSRRSGNGWDGRAGWTWLGWRAKFGLVKVAGNVGPPRPRWLCHFRSNCVGQITVFPLPSAKFRIGVSQSRFRHVTSTSQPSIYLDRKIGSCSTNSTFLFCLLPLVLRFMCAFFSLLRQTEASGGVHNFEMRHRDQLNLQSLQGVRLFANSPSLHPCKSGVSTMTIFVEPHVSPCCSHVSVHKPQIPTNDNDDVECHLWAPA